MYKNGGARRVNSERMRAFSMILCAQGFGEDFCEGAFVELLFRYLIEKREKRFSRPNPRRFNVVWDRECARSRVFSLPIFIFEKRTIVLDLIVHSMSLWSFVWTFQQVRGQTFFMTSMWTAYIIHGVWCGVDLEFELNFISVIHTWI